MPDFALGTLQAQYVIQVPESTLMWLELLAALQI